MARAPKDSRLDSREARSRLKPRKEPYWKQVVPGTFLGLAKGRRGSAWIARQRSGEGYKSQRIGTPDDYADPDGFVVLTYTQAVARASAVQAGTRPPRHYGDGAKLNDVVGAYIDHREKHPGGRTGRPMSATAATMTRALWKLHGSESIGASVVTSLSADKLREWHSAMAQRAATKRGKGGVRVPVEGFSLKNPAQAGARQSSANRLLTIAKAALQHARTSGRLPEQMPDFWRQVRPFAASARDAPPRMLELDEITRLLNAAEPGLRDLLRAGLMTGARYGELAALRVGDYSGETGTVRVAQSKTGKVLVQPLTPEGRQFFDRATAGRDLAEPMLLRTDGTPWGKSHAARPMRHAATAARVRGVSFKTARATYGKLLLIATGNIELTAKALGHSDSRITRKHYAQYLPGELAAGIARMPRLEGKQGAKVVPMRRKA